MTATESEAGVLAGRSHLLLLTELLLFTVGLAGCLIMQVDRAQPTPYMDEIFHAPMAQKYCRGVWTEWDPKITTPPGLYALSSGLLWLTSWLSPVQPDGPDKATRVDCSLFKLRLTNLAYFAVTFLSIYGILSSRRHYGNSQEMLEPRIRVLKSLCLSLFPVSFFFVSLFYTDQASLACLLAAYFMHLNEHSVATGLLGCLAVACRQTNAVWLLFLLGVSLERAWLARVRGLDKRQREARDAGANDDDDEAESSLSGNLAGIISNPVDFLATCLRVALIECWPLTATLAGFACLVYVNGGIALGDRSAHEARLHSPQVMYFLAFAVAMHPTALLGAKLPGGGVSQLAVFSALCGVCCLAVRYQTYEHPYLLADNRHLTFYAWRRLFQRHWSVRYLLTPGYVACLGIYWRTVRRSGLFRLALLICTGLALIPAPLIEPRYFAAPWTLWRLSASRRDTRLCLLVEIAWFACVNAAVYWLFFKRPFHWPDVSEPQRFIW